MNKKGYISEFMGGGRIVSHGKITDLTEGFSLPNGALFSIYVRPRNSGDSAVDTILSVKCYQDDDFSEAPIVYNDWSPLAIRELAPDAEVLELCDIYWGSGQNIEEEV